MTQNITDKTQLLAERIAAARGEIQPDLLLKNARLINVLSGEIYDTDIAIHDGAIVGLGSGYTAKQEVDLQGRYAAPGFIDAHVHIESSLCTPPEFSRIVLTHGVTSVVTDPHEIANVLGLEGIRFMLERSEDAPITVYVMASSCVPATHMETSGASLDADDLGQLLSSPRVLGLAEVMNYPGVVYGDEDMLEKITLFSDRPMDGHSPALTGKALNAYVASGIGSDHECTTPAEALEKLRLGTTILIREGTTTHNLKALLPMVTAANHHRLCFCTDDRQPGSLIDQGSIDYMIRTAIAEGIDPIMAIRMGTINTANWFRLYDRGAIAPGRKADIVIFSDLHNIQAEMVFHEGVLVAQAGKVVQMKPQQRDIDLRASMNVRRGEFDFNIVAKSERIRVIEGFADQVVTGHRVETAKIVDGYAVSDPDRDILKMAVIERHQASGNIGKGFISGFGLKHGAIAGTVAHDHHNLIVIGADDASMARAAQVVIEMGGGLAAVDGDQMVAVLALPVGGLMTEQPIADVRREYDRLIAAAQDMGSTMFDPFMAMSFMALEVIPKLKLTDVGLVDVEKFQLVDLFA